MDEVEKNKTVEKDMKKLVNKSWFRYQIHTKDYNHYRFVIVSFLF